MPKITASAPYLLVRDVVASANYFRDALGFRYDRTWGEPPDFCICHRDEHYLMLSGVHPHVVENVRKLWGEMWSAYFWIDDADALFAELKANGAHIAYEPCDKFYDIREFAVRDPDGNVVAFGQPIRKLA